MLEILHQLSKWRSATAVSRSSLSVLQKLNLRRAHQQNSETQTSRTAAPLCQDQMLQIKALHQRLSHCKSQAVMHTDNRSLFYFTKSIQQSCKGYLTPFGWKDKLVDTVWALKFMRDSESQIAGPCLHEIDTNKICNGSTAYRSTFGAELVKIRCCKDKQRALGWQCDSTYAMEPHLFNL